MVKIAHFVISGVEEWRDRRSRTPEAVKCSITRNLAIANVEGIYSKSVTLKSGLEVTQDH